MSLQRWLQGGKTEAMYVGMYSRAMDEMMSKLIRKTRPSGLEVRAGPGHAGDALPLSSPERRVALFGSVSDVHFLPRGVSPYA